MDIILFSCGIDVIQFDVEVMIFEMGHQIQPTGLDVPCTQCIGTPSHLHV